MMTKSRDVQADVSASSYTKSSIETAIHCRRVQRFRLARFRNRSPYSISTLLVDYADGERAISLARLLTGDVNIVAADNVAFYLPVELPSVAARIVLVAT